MKKYKVTVTVDYEVEGENFDDAQVVAYWTFKEYWTLSDFSIDIEEIKERKENK